MCLLYTHILNLQWLFLAICNSKSASQQGIVLTFFLLPGNFSIILSYIYCNTCTFICFLLSQLRKSLIVPASYLLVSLMLMWIFFGGGGVVFLLFKITIQIFLIGYTTMTIAYSAKTECRKVGSFLGELHEQYFYYQSVNVKKKKKKGKLT